MKGQAFIIPESMIDILKNLLTIAVFLGLFLLFAVYNIKIHDTTNARMIFDRINSIIGNKCLIYEDEGGNFYRSIFDGKKLDQGNLCVNSKDFEVEITDFESTWKFGSSQNRIKITLPITVYSGGKFKFGKMVISY